MTGAGAFALALLLFMAACAPEAMPTERERLRASDPPYVWSFDERQDLQLPELPTGCEATAAATAARMAGAVVTKTQVADALPKDGTDWVHAFRGDPYTERGWACSAPAIERTMNGLFEVEERYAAMELTGTALAELPTPCVVWVSIGLAEPTEVDRREGYGLFRNSHAMTLTHAGEATVEVVDPLRGVTAYDREAFERVYDAMGRQAVYIGELADVLRLHNEKGQGK